MKYPVMKEIPVKKVGITSGKKGVNLSKNSNKLEEGEFSAVKNVYIKNGRTVTRPAIKTDVERVLSTEFLSGASLVDYTLTDTVYHNESGYYRISVANVFYDSSNYFVKVFLIDESGGFEELGSLHFARVSSDVYFIPESVTFYVGKAQRGSGIFALVSLVNCEDFSQKDPQIYEFSFENKTWCEAEDFYVPTVLINGRGNSYEFAKENGSPYTAAPRELEALNLLDGRFYSYFTSDGYSSGFKLPFTQIADTEITVTLYHDKQLKTEWVVQTGESAASLDFFGEEVTVNVDRESGIIYFTKQNVAFALPQMVDYAENNLKIMARKEIPDGLYKVVSCSTCAAVGDKMLFSGGDEKSAIYYTDFENPLYFPQIFDNLIGSPKTAVTSLFGAPNFVLAFKDNEVWQIDVKFGKTLNKTTLVRDNAAYFKAVDSYNVKALSTIVGCNNENTIVLNGDSVIWLSPDRNVYKLKNGRIENLSQKIKPFLQELSQDEIDLAKASVTEGYYMLCFASKTVIIETEKEETPAFLWEFPDELSVIGAFSHKGKTTLISINSQDNTCFTCSFGKGKDCFARNNSNNIEICEREFESFIKTKSYFPFSFNNRARLNEVCLQFDCSGDSEISFVCGKCEKNFKLAGADLYNEGNFIRFKVGLECREDTYMTLSSYGEFSFGDAELYFNKIC